MRGHSDDRSRIRLLQALNDDPLREVAILDFDAHCARRFGELRGTQLSTGRTVNPVDLMIASVALVHDLTLITHNVQDFHSIPGLRVVDWLLP